MNTSKGLQEKWVQDGVWHKVDSLGHEALSEFVTAQLLKNCVQLPPTFVNYEICKLDDGRIACRSKDFLQQGEMYISLERLYAAKMQGASLAKVLSTMEDVTQRIKHTVEFVERNTGLNKFGSYLTFLLDLDALLLNEDRHTHNIGIVYDTKTDSYRVSPIFDNGLALLADHNDYHGDVYMDIEKVHAKPFSQSFDEQVDCAESLYGQQLQLNQFRNIFPIIDRCKMFYDDDLVERIKTALREQHRKYRYFGN